MRVAITGGTGFVGSHLATRLSSEGHEVVRIGRRSTGEDQIIKASLDDVDPELLRTYEKLGIPLNEQKFLSGVAVDAIFDSGSVGRSRGGELEARGIVFCSLGVAV